MSGLEVVGAFVYAALLVGALIVLMWNIAGLRARYDDGRRPPR